MRICLFVYLLLVGWYVYLFLFCLCACLIIILNLVFVVTGLVHKKAYEVCWMIQLYLNLSFPHEVLAWQCLEKHFLLFTHCLSVQLVNIWESNKPDVWRVFENGSFLWMFPGGLVGWSPDIGLFVKGVALLDDRLTLDFL